MVKKETFPPFPFNKKQALMSSFALSLLINLIFILCFFFLFTQNNPASNIEWNKMLAFFGYHFTCNFILLFILYNFVNILSRKKNKERRRASLEVFGGTILICCFISPVLSRIQWSLLHIDSAGRNLSFFVAFNMGKDLILGILMLLETGIRYTTYRRHQTVVMNQGLIKENIKTRYEALKNQLDPHFLFNSLNTLNGLIGIDNEKAHEYVDNLSSVFRYTLNSKNICKLNNELEFVNAYVDLLKIRYGENLVVHYNIEDKYRNYLLMPVSIQLLVENAIKHNIISKKKPLFILIETTDEETLIVQNIINPRFDNKEGNGVGLANLTNRYAILFQKSISIRNVEGIFTVEIPLIPTEEKAIKPGGIALVEYESINC